MRQSHKIILEIYFYILFTKAHEWSIIMANKVKESVLILQMIKKLLTLKVTFSNVLGLQKYTKKTTVPKGKVCVLGISKL